MALIQTIGERTYTYSHCAGSLFAFTAPSDMVLGPNGTLPTLLAGAATRATLWAAGSTGPSGTWKMT